MSYLTTKTTHNTATAYRSSITQDPIGRLDVLAKIFRLKGKPYRPYRPFEFFFQRDIPRSILVKAGRQVSKTTTSMFHHILLSLQIPFLKTLIVLPLEQQAIRVGTEFLKPLAEESSLKALIDEKTYSKNYVSFKNNSTIEIVFASKNLEGVDRIRSKAADKLHIDEVQDIHPHALPVIIECLSSSKHQLMVFTGTPKTRNNLLQFLWNESSQGEWIIPCSYCGYENVPSLDQDLLNIIGDYREDISPEKPGTICAKCHNIINPDKGFWVHKYPNKDTKGFHIPQIIIPHHYSNAENWKRLIQKREGMFQYTPAQFLQEVLGEAAETAHRLITLDDLLRVATLGDRRRPLETFKAYAPRYSYTTLGIDWGGGGETRNYTTIVYAGIRPDGVIEIPYAVESKYPHDHLYEAKLIFEIANTLGVNFIAHDFSGQGSLRETFLVHNGFPLERLLPCRYVGNMNVAYQYCPPTAHNPRACYNIDPNRCMLLTIGAIKAQRILFFNDDYINDQDTGLLRQFISLIDETHEFGLKDNYRITHEEGYPDEFCQGVMLASLCLWMVTKQWPNFGS